MCSEESLVFLKLKPLSSKPCEATLLTDTTPVTVMLVADAPAPLSLIPFDIASDVHEHVPAGTMTVSPPDAAVSAACTSDCEQLEAEIVAAPAAGTHAKRANSGKQTHRTLWMTWFMAALHGQGYFHRQQLRPPRPPDVPPSAGVRRVEPTLLEISSPCYQRR
ncbi:MAG: hypothetical protein AMJ58_03710 [Gammaproteobacteria bacterium SG8_30]|nr:MAG: hypothetical protein AMJ58_03710 [Gammaproteobacteria bacterium SG8_30]